jgi:hypothetical protein
LITGGVADSSKSGLRRRHFSGLSVSGYGGNVVSVGSVKVEGQETQKEKTQEEENRLA